MRNKVEMEQQSRGLDTSVRYVKGVGEARAALLAKLDIFTVRDLLFYAPRRYEDRTVFLQMRALSGAQVCTLRGEVKSAGWQRPRYGKQYFQAVISDGTGLLTVRWFNAGYLQDVITPGAQLILYGKVGQRKGIWTMQHPDFEVIKDESELNSNRIVPVYGLTDQLPQKTLRKIVWHAIEGYLGDVHDVLPVAWTAKLGYPDRAAAVRSMHFPAQMDEAFLARDSLAFEEFLTVQLALCARKNVLDHAAVGKARSFEGVLKAEMLKLSGFMLTGAQQRVIAEIEQDLRSEQPMHRLLQGDVGSGKTLAAAAAVLDVVESGAQAAVMAPTEILAHQHEQTFRKLLEPLNIRMVSLTGSTSAARRREILPRIENGWFQVVIGTHALIQDKIQFHEIGMAVIDEQHKFGVQQRGQLYQKNQTTDILVMTATPIPRTLAMTIYGDLDVSVIDELPPGRSAPVTRVIGEDKLEDAYEFIVKQVKKGRQAYLVYPLVADSETLDLKSAESMYEQLCTTVFRTVRTGLLHGQLSTDEKESVMRQFTAGDLDVLIATTVIEVGVDVPNATVMMIENAERFGLSQLHQLRGRIGRGDHKAFCILQGEPKSRDSWKRLRIMERTHDGFQIAEEDLEIRGMGNLMGKEQSGLPLLRIAHPVRDQKLLVRARQTAQQILHSDPGLEQESMRPLRRLLKEIWAEAEDFLSVG